LEVEHEETVPLTTFLVNKGSMLFLRICRVNVVPQNCGVPSAKLTRSHCFVFYSPDTVMSRLQRNVM